MTFSDYSAMNLGMNHKVAKNKSKYLKVLQHIYKYFTTQRGSHNIIEKYLRLD